MRINTKLILNLTCWAFIIFVLYVISRYNYLLFHTLVEFFAIVIAVGVFMLAWNARQFLDNNYFLFISIAYLFVACIDTIHTIAYRGMAVFTGFAIDLSIQLWIMARYIQAFSLLFAPFFVKKRFNIAILFIIYSILTGSIFYLIFFLKIIPVCWVEGVGLTPFKKISEYIISIILMFSIVLLNKNRKAFDPIVFRYLVVSTILFICSELAFTLYTDVYGFFSTVGHYFKLVAFYLIYLGIIEIGLKKPYRVLFKNLKESELLLRRRTELLETLNKELDSFSYSVSHDLREPLRAIANFCHILYETYNDKFDEEGKRIIKVITSNVAKAQLLIENLLQFSRTTGKEMRKESIDMNQLVQRIWEDIKSTFKQRNISFILKDLPRAYGDEKLLALVFNNLLSNAVKFTQPKTRSSY